MLIIISTIPHKKQRYPTVGDWLIHESEDSVEIIVSRMDNWKYEMCVAIHEFTEAILCMDRGITQELVDKFDKDFEAKREAGNTDEPGDSSRAPYRKEHFFATTIERLLAAELGVDWQSYEAVVNSL